MKKYIFLYNGDSKKKLDIFCDLRKLPNVQLLPVKKNQKIIMTLNQNDEYIIITMPTLFYICNIEDIKKIGKMTNVKLVLILLDTIGLDSPTSRIAYNIYKDTMWDYVFTYDEYDSQKYNLIYLEGHYYSKLNIKNKAKTKIDVYFIGALKPGRTNELVELYTILKSNGLNVEFDVIEKDRKKN